MVWRRPKRLRFDYYFRVKLRPAQFKELQKEDSEFCKTFALIPAWAGIR
jgi:hypothetical protein